MGYYTSYLKEGICQQTGIDFAIAVRSIGRDGPATGGGPDVVRLTVAYFCPHQGGGRGERARVRHLTFEQGG